MVGNSKKDDQFKPGTLDEFKERFGEVSDRFELAVHPYLEQQDMPSAEHPQMIEERLEAENAAEQGEKREFLPDEEVKPEFTKAADHLPDQEESPGKGSLMVQDESAQHNMTPPPETAKDQDRQTHYDRMSEDDQFSRENGVEMSESYYADLEARMEDYALEQEALGNDQAQDRDRDQGQDFTP